MKRLSLEDFKTKSENTKELENLTGGILGACHCRSSNCAENGATSTWSYFVHKYIEGGHTF